MEPYVFNEQPNTTPVGYRHTATKKIGADSELMVIMEYRPQGQAITGGDFARMIESTLVNCRSKQVLDLAQQVIRCALEAMPDLLGARVTVEVREVRKDNALSPGYADAITVEYKAPAPDVVRIPPGQQVAQNPEA